MNCENCDMAQATIHITRIVGGKKRKSHLCKECAAEKALPKAQINLPALLQALLGQNDMAQVDCPCCGIGFMEFRSNGRLGCPHDYEAFRKALTPLIQRLHVKINHKGKRPSRPLGKHKSPLTFDLKARPDGCGFLGTIRGGGKAQTRNPTTRPGNRFP